MGPFVWRQQNQSIILDNLSLSNQGVKQGWHVSPGMITIAEMTSVESQMTKEGPRLKAG